MLLIREVKTNYQPASAGTHAAVCVDVVDMGFVESTFDGKSKKQRKIRIVWQIDEIRDDGKPFQVSRLYTLSLNEKSTLRRDLESWRGRPFTSDELTGFDIDSILGAPALLNLTRVNKGDATYANVKSIMRLPKEMTAPVPRDYVRVDRPAQGD